MAFFTAIQRSIIEQHPLESDLHYFRSTFRSTYPHISVHGHLDHFEKIVGENGGKDLALQLVVKFQAHRAALSLPPYGHKGSVLVSDVALLFERIALNQADIKHAARLLRDVVAGKDDFAIWATMYELIRDTMPSPSLRPVHPTTPPQSSPPPSSQGASTFDWESIIATSELRHKLDPLLWDEVDRNLIVDHPRIFDAIYGRITQFAEVAEAVFNACKSSNAPTYDTDTGWTDWPSSCSEDDVLHFLRRHVEYSSAIAEDHGFRPANGGRCFALLNQPLGGFVANRELDVGLACGISGHRAIALGALLTRLLGGLRGHESLVVRPNILHRDISLGNILLNAAEDDGFLIDLDLAVQMDRPEPSEASTKVGTKVFMAIGALYGEPYLSANNRESFFWLLFWIGAHWNGAETKLANSEKYDKWNLMSTEDLAMVKNFLATEDDKFIGRLEAAFTAYCELLIPFMEELRTVVFPGNKRRKMEDPKLYEQMVAVLERAREGV